MSRFRSLLALLMGLTGCRDKVEQSASESVDPAGAAGQSSLEREVSEASRAAAAAAVAKSINPSGLPPYSGPVGALRGLVTSTGDAPPNTPESQKLPAAGCPRADQMYRKLFRLGPNAGLADALVTITEYQGYLEPDPAPVRVRAEGCAWSSRTVALTFGQRLEIENVDSEPYIPRLDGAPTLALRIAMPRGNPVPLFAPQAGKYALVEQTRDYMRADVFILNYPTARVTGLDGRFAFDGIPVGPVRVTAYLPATGKSVDQRITIEAGVTKELALELPFSLTDYDSAQAAPAPK